MSDSLNDFIREALHEHDAGKLLPDQTLPNANPGAMRGLGALPGHEVEDLIARGGMGAVYLARQQTLEREVAVKVMTARAESPEMAARFRREALVLGKLAHPNIVPVYDIGTDDEGHLFYTMKLVKGRTLQHILNALRDLDAEALRTHTLATLLTVFRKVCDALSFAHSRGIIHRDLKPENIMVGEFGEVLLMDWGLAKKLNDECRMPNDKWGTSREGFCSFDIRHSDFTALHDSVAPTLVGAVMGTPQYMSPEQAAGQIDELDARSDIFSLGGILYAILTLRAPVEGGTTADVLAKVRAGAIASPSSFGATASRMQPQEKSAAPEVRKGKSLPHLPGGKVPVALSAVAMGALRLEKSRRYQSVAEFSADIEAYQGGFATKAQEAGAWTQLLLLMRRHRAVAALLAVMVVSTIAFVIKVMSSERKATHHAELAMQNERQALVEKEATRRAFARSQIALADAAAVDLDGVALRRALDACPEDLRDSTWRYLDAKADVSLEGLTKDNIDAYGAAFRRTGEGAASGEFLLAHLRDPIIHAVRPDTGQILREMKVSIKGRKFISLNGDGSELIVGSQTTSDYEIIDSTTGASLLRRQAPGVGEVLRIHLSPDGKRILMLLMEPKQGARRLICLDRASGATIWEQPEWHAFWVSANGEWLAAMMPHFGKEVGILRADTGERISTLETGHNYLLDMSFSADGRLIAGGDYDGFATIWERASGRRLQSFRVCAGGLSTVAFAADGSLITMGQSTAERNSQRQIQVWNIDRVVPLDAMLGMGTLTANSLALDPVGGWMCTDGPVPKFWHLPMQGQREQIKHRQHGFGVSFLGRDTLFVQHGLIVAEVYRVGSETSTLLPQPPNLGIAFAVSGDHSRVLVVDRPKRTNWLATPAADGKLEFTKPIWDIAATSVALDANGSHALTTSMTGTLQLWAPGRSGAIREWKNQGVERWRLPAFSKDGRLLLAVASRHSNQGREESVLCCWDRDTGALLRQFVHPAIVAALIVSPDGRRLAFAGSDKTVFILALSDFRLEQSFRAHDKAINGIAWHPTRPLLATVSDDVSLKLWNATDGRPLAKFRGLSRSLLSVAFNQPGDLMAVGTANQSTLIYETETLLRGGVAESP